MEDKLLQIIEHFGVLTQQKKLAEEIHELNQAITLYEAQLSGEYEMPLTYLIGTKEHIIEELADVLIVLSQFMYYYDLQKKDIDKAMRQKIDRTIERIENGYYI